MIDVRGRVRIAGSRRVPGRGCGTREGFTLVEIILAAAVASVVAVGVLGSLNGIAGAFDRYREETQLAYLLQAVAGEVLGRGKPAAEEGSFDTHPGYRWAIRSRALAEALEAMTDPPPVSAATRLQVLTITVTAPSGRQTTGTVIAG